MLYSLCIVFIAIGLYGVFVKKNVVKIVLGLLIVEYGINFLLVLAGYRQGGSAPIAENSAQAAVVALQGVDPLAQAMVVASLTMGLGMLLVMVALCIRLYERYGTFDVTEMRRLKG